MSEHSYHGATYRFSLVLTKSMVTVALTSDLSPIHPGKLPLFLFSKLMFYITMFLSILKFNIIMDGLEIKKSVFVITHLLLTTVNFYVSRIDLQTAINF